MKNWLLLTIEFILLILFLIECLIRTIIYPFYWKIWKSQFITIKWYHGLNNKYRKSTKKEWSQYYDNLGIILILTLCITSCTSTNSYAVIKIDNCEYITSLFNSKGLLHKANCSNHPTCIEPRSYQIQVTDSMNLLYDGNRLVGVLPFNQYEPSVLDVVIIRDNQ